MIRLSSHAHRALCSHSKTTIRSMTKCAPNASHCPVVELLVFLLLVPEQSILFGSFCTLNQIGMRTPNRLVYWCRVQKLEDTLRTPDRTNPSDLDLHNFCPFISLMRQKRQPESASDTAEKTSWPVQGVGLASVLTVDMGAIFRQFLPGSDQGAKR